MVDRSLNDEASLVAEDLGAVETVGFEEFFAAEHARLYSALCAVTGNRQEAEEIMQEAFLKLWERWERVSGLDDPVGYLYRTAMNVFRQRLRRAKVAMRKAVRSAEHEDAYEEIDTREVVIQGLRALQPRQRAAVVLTSLRGFSSEEAAEMLGMSPGAVRMLATRGRASMRKAVEPVTTAPDILERTFPAPPDAFDRLVRRRAKRERTRKIADGALALILVVLLVAALAGALALRRQRPEPLNGPITPSNVSQLGLVWSSPPSDRSIGAAPLAVDDHVFVIDMDDRLRVYPRSCGADVCSPLWSTRLGPSTEWGWVDRSARATACTCRPPRAHRRLSDHLRVGGDLRPGVDRPARRGFLQCLPGRCRRGRVRGGEPVERRGDRRLLGVVPVGAATLRATVDRLGSGWVHRLAAGGRERRRLRGLDDGRPVRVPDLVRARPAADAGPFGPRHRPLRTMPPGAR